VGTHLADREISIGDYVLSGGELGAAVIVDTVTRLIPGALGNEASSRQESFFAEPEVAGGDWSDKSVRPFDKLRAGSTRAEATGVEPKRADSTCASGGLLDYPHYTRPAEFRGIKVPDVLMSGNHEDIKRWRRRSALEKTLRNRPDLLERAELSEQDRELLAEIAGGKS
jgi:tRNA (guanine37-N1)-methyltransferase